MALAVATLSAGTQGPPPGPAATSVIKAVYLFNFARFTEWPTPAVKGPLTLCIFGAPDVAASLDRLVGDRPLNGRDVSVARVEALGLASSCHLLYVPVDDSAVISGVLDAVAALPVFTVGEGDRFAKAGGVAALFTEDGRTRFTINPDALSRAGLRVSSQMMGLARLVKGAPR